MEEVQNNSLGNQFFALIQKKKIKTKFVATGVAGALLLSFAGYYFLGSGISFSSQKQKKVDGGAVVSVVNGQAIYDIEIAPLLSQAPKAVAVDSYINKVLTAQEAQETGAWQDEIKTRIQAANREVLAQMYLEKRSAELQAATSEEQIADFYSKNISETMFAKYSASYSLYADADSAAQAAKAISEGDTEALKNFKPFQDEKGKPASFVPQQFPYDLGKVIQNLGVGAYSNPLPTRNGYFILRLDQKAEGKKPEIKEIRGQLLQAIVSQKLSEDIASLRSKAKIELR